MGMKTFRFSLVRISAICLKTTTYIFKRFDFYLLCLEWVVLTSIFAAEFVFHLKQKKYD